MKFSTVALIALLCSANAVPVTTGDDLAEAATEASAQPASAAAVVNEQLNEEAPLATPHYPSMSEIFRVQNWVHRYRDSVKAETELEFLDANQPDFTNHEIDYACGLKELWEGHDFDTVPEIEVGESGFAFWIRLETFIHNRDVAQVELVAYRLICESRTMPFKNAAGDLGDEDSEEEN